MQADAAPGVLGADLGELGTNFQFVLRKPPGWSPCNLASVSPTLPPPRHAFSTDQLVADVAQDVVGLRLRFDPSTSPSTHDRGFPPWSVA